MIKFSNAILKFFAVILGIFTALTISLSATYGINGNLFKLNRHSEPAKYFWVYSTIILGAVTIALGILLLFKIINGFSRKQLKIASAVLLAVFITGCFTVIFMFPTIPMTDAFYVHDTAISFAKGSISQIDGTSNYYRKYSNNNMMVYLLALIYRTAHILGIKDLLTVGRIVNACAVSICEVSFFLGIKKLTGKLSTGVKFLLISILYPTMMFMSSWVYTATFSMPLIGILVLLSTYIVKSKSLKTCAVLSSICGATIALGYFLRPIVVIIGIAYFICLILWTIRDKKRLIKSAFITVFALVFFVGCFAVCKTIDKTFYTGSDRNFPLSHWVAMGLIGNGTYNQQLVDMAQASKTTEEANKKALENIVKTIENYTFGDFMLHQYIKHGTIWGDGTQLYNQRIAGPSVAKEIDFFTWGYKNAYLCAYCQMFWLALHILTMLYVISFIIKKQSRFSLGFAVAILGAYGFYSIWEVKPSYATPFVPLFIVLAVFGGEFAEGLLPLRHPTGRMISRIVCSAVIGIKIFAFILGGIYSVCVVNDYVSPAFVVTSTHNEFMDTLAQSHTEITQYFSLNKPFNCLKIRIHPQKKPFTYCEYEVLLSNSTGKKLAETTIRKPYNQQFCNIELAKLYRPKGYEVFKLSVNSIGNGDKLGIGYSSGENIDTVQGDFIVNGKKSKGDLWIKAERIDRKPYMTLTNYIIISAIILILNGFIFYQISAPKKSGCHTKM